MRGPNPKNCCVLYSSTKKFWFFASHSKTIQDFSKISTDLNRGTFNLSFETKKSKKCRKSTNIEETKNLWNFGFRKVFALRT